MSIYDFDAVTISGDEVSLSGYKDKIVLIVNTASKCGYTPQFEGLESLYKTFGDDGFVVLGFPCNQFAKQEPAENQKINEFCQLNYGVSFPMFAKIDVNGRNTHPLFSYLKKNARGVLGSQSIKWNFTKFLINRDGEVVKRYATRTTPNEIKADISALMLR